MAKIAVSIVVLLVSLTQFIVNGATISSVETKLIQETQFIESTVSSARTEISNHVSTSKSALNSDASRIKANIRSGPASCQVWTSQIESIEKSSINFMYQYQPCEKNGDLNTVGFKKNDLKTIQNNLQKLRSVCGLVRNCQSQIDSFDASIDVIHNHVASKVSQLLAESKSCVESRSGTTQRSLTSAEEAWKKCVSTA